MKKLLHPNQKILFVLVLIALGGMLGIYAIHVNLQSNIQVIFLSICGTLLGLVFLYAIYGYARLVLAFLKSAGGIKGYVKMLKNDQRIRILSGACLSCLVTALLAIYEWALAVVFKEIFLLTISAIYIFLAAGRLYLILKEDKIESNKSDIDLILGGIVFLTGIAVAGVSILVYKNEGSFEHRGLLIYAIAAYSFYIFVWTIISTIKARRHHNFYRLTFLRLTQVKALYTVFTLTVSMLLTFDIENQSLDEAGKIGLGMTITFLILLYSGYLFISGIKSKKLERETKEIPVEEENSETKQ